MKKLLILFMTLCTAFGLLSCRQGDIRPSDTANESAQSSVIEHSDGSNSSSSVSEEEGESAIQTPATSEENSSTQAPTTSEEPSTSEDEPSVPSTDPKEANDIATSGFISSRAPQNYGTIASLSIQDEVVSMDSSSALKGVFNTQNATPYQGYMIWTFADIHLQNYFKKTINLWNYRLVFDLKTENIGIYSSFIVVRSNGEQYTEKTFEYSALPSPSNSTAIGRRYLGEDWYRYTIDFGIAYPSYTGGIDGANVLLTFGNQECANHYSNSIFYLDNIHLTDLDGNLVGRDNGSGPLSPEENDLTYNAPFLSRAPENYGATSTLLIQSDVVSENSTTALKGFFNNKGAPVYAGYQVWTWASLKLQAHYGQTQDVSKKTLTYEMKTDNCGPYSSIIVMSASGERSAELTFKYTDTKQPNEAITCVPLQNGWYRITIDFFLAYFNNPVLSDAAEILIMFTNQDCANHSVDSIFYIDNMRLANSSSAEDMRPVTVFNPEGYYKKTSVLHITIAGNSFVAPNYSNSASLLEEICQQQGISVYVDYVSVGNGRIPDQYEQAFASNGYMRKNRVDVLFIQDFYSASDAIALREFLTTLYAISPTTELKVYAGENETEDGYRAACAYGVDHVDWRTAIKTLKNEHAFGTMHLNANDGWHPNALSGLVGAIMMYMELYGEQPDFEVVKSLAKSTVWGYLPGVDEGMKISALTTIYTVASSLVLGK